MGPHRSTRVATIHTTTAERGKGAMLSTETLALTGCSEAWRPHRKCPDGHLGAISTMPNVANAHEGGVGFWLPGGKSQVQIDLVARATRGDGWPDGARSVAPMNVIMLTAEDALDQEVIPRLRAADANLARIRFLVSIKRDTNGGRMFFAGRRS